MKRVKITDRASRGEAPFKAITVLFSLVVLFLSAVVVYELVSSSMPAFKKFGFGFLTSKDWDPVQQVFGALPFIWGSFYTSLIALILALPVSIGIAIFLTELAPIWLRQPVGFIIELIGGHPQPDIRPVGTFRACPYYAGVCRARTDEV